MDNPEDAGKEAGLAVMAAALLEQGRHIHAASLVVMAGTIGLAIITAMTGRLDAGVALLGTGALFATIAELWLAIRVGFDAALFRAFACREADMPQLDSALQHLGLMPAEKAGRPVELRIKGALRLLRQQGLCLLVALLLLFGAFALFLMRNGGASS